MEDFVQVKTFQIGGRGGKHLSSKSYNFKICSLIIHSKILMTDKSEPSVAFILFLCRSSTAPLFLWSIYTVTPEKLHLHGYSRVTLQLLFMKKNLKTIKIIKNSILRNRTIHPKRNNS